MKIAIDPLFLYTSPYTGISVYTKNIITELLKDKTIKIVLPYFGNNNDELLVLKRKFSNKNLEIRHIKIPGKLSRLAWAYSTYPKVERYLTDIDLYHAPFWVIPPIKSIPIVLTVYDIFTFTDPKLFPLFSRWVNNKRIKNVVVDLLAGRNINLISISQYTKSELIKNYHISSKKIKTIYLAASGKFNAEAASAVVKQKYNLPNHYFLAVGSLNPRKNIENLIGAFDIFSNSNKDFKLVLLGTQGWKNKRVLSKIRENSNILWLGVVPESDLPGIYKAATIFVFPSLCEGFGLPVIESMACGTPVITSNTSAMKEVASDAALLIDPLNKVDIAEKMVRLASDIILQQDLRYRGFTISSNYTWGKTIRETVDYYKQIL
ncbi:MAG: hypothetical protein A3G60_03335 [Candidatus Ryanbacteria bacterium RIFCSPLOWO2_12_FULL_47_9c]|uniref:Uncharacterized protein n=2 Tax=Candidatus Ryaniibacteriota TaxID=1817914 RepID=A0A1G2H6X8_9BACT|nr:MAG: Glycosyl transferase group 1 [Parcubacteria group bacterium GW2011_GWA2_47_10b]KKU86430.1 MAG: Glycosyl transferase group 1 [Parcubacteria group bacterium GW2011_GWA1_47_9]OGZ47891.1 MAG: hypothetical protein A3C83_03140 [Candidatus Ryanbacteria bacterium RIFCSPHIGHO2_02_FULL_47_25]OGZ56367.1 MAG: hypothetical protein A3J04_03610 [Candidatus Ryanbacteria bacterium RIFCSPLOWO2_02_FULL_47_14]OGZ58060.1 MAG: hypothetical protein A3G60_03335 [Candidatus Ryanbacteria bacterium RIFCSPLOWO2_12